MKVCAVVNTGDNADDSAYYWRVDLPFKFLEKNKSLVENEDGGSYFRVVNADNDEEIPEDAEIVILPKMNIPEDSRLEALAMFRRLRENGAKIVYDADDDLWSEHFTRHVTQMAHGSKDNPKLNLALINDVEKLRESNLWTLLQCDSVIVASEALANYVRFISNKPTIVVENAIDIDGFAAQLNPYINERSDSITIGWAGGRRPQHELDNMLGAWDQIKLEFPDVRFKIAGWMPDLRKYSNLKLGSNPVSSLWRPIENYAINYRVDIGCVCVGNNPFSERKTPIKAWEFALAGAMVVGSRALYSTEPIPTAETVDDWIKILRFYIIAKEERKAMAEAYRKYIVANYDMKFKWYNWFLAYRQILGGINASSAVTV